MSQRYKLHKAARDSLEKLKGKKKSVSGNKPTSKFEHKTSYHRRRLSKIFQEFLDKSGVEITAAQFMKTILFVDIGIVGTLSLVIIIAGIIQSSPIGSVLSLLFWSWTVLFLAVYLLSMLASFFYLDMRLYQRTKQIEDVLPDFLQLTAANISAGMPIDRALWFAVRPRFGILAKEMEEIAKSTFTGDPLQKSLMKFTKKYHSRILKESMNLIVAGMNSGGEIGDLLNKIAENIQETKLMKKEIAASVTTYVIFIAVASIMAAPVLFALSSQLLNVISNIAQSMTSNAGANSMSALSISFSGNSISSGDFTTFSIVLLVITSFFAAAIISVIRKGNAKNGIKQFPIYVVVALLIYAAASWILGLLLGSFF